MRIRIIGAILALVLAVVGTVAIVLYVRDADTRAAQGAELVPVYVVQTTIAQGTSAEELRDSIRVERLARNSILPDRVTDLSDIDGLVTTITLLPGDQLVTSRFADPADLAAEGNVLIPDGMQEVTIALPVEQVVGGAIRGGSTVGIVISVVDDTGTTTQFALHKVLVTRVQAGDNYVANPGVEESATPVATIMVTLALKTPDVERVIWAAELQQADRGGIWLTLEPASADESGSRPVNREVAFG